MRAINLTLIFILPITLSIIGQNFPTDSAYWKTEHGSVTCLDPDMLNYMCWEKQYFLQNDTVIENQEYNKLFCNGKNRNPSNEIWTYFDEGYIGAIRQESETKKVYYRPDQSSEEYLLYDFDLNIGDTLPTSYVYDPEMAGIITIDFIDTVIIAADTIIRFHMDEAGFGEEYLIDGIGSSLGLLEEISPFFEHHYALLYFENHETLLTYPEFGNCELITSIDDIPSQRNISITIIPNPTTGLSLLRIKEIEEKHYRIQISDLSGKILYDFTSNEETTELNLETYKSGIYILSVIIENKIISREKIIKK